MREFRAKRLPQSDCLAIAPIDSPVHEAEYPLAVGTIGPQEAASWPNEIFRLHSPSFAVKETVFRAGDVLLVII